MNWKLRVRIKLLPIFMIALVVIIVLGTASYTNRLQFSQQDKVIHLSVDDVINVFEDITINQNHYKSIFDNKVLAHLRLLHEEYDACFSMYCFYEQGDFNLSQCPDKYHNEFFENSNWLRFGYHAQNCSTEPGTITADEIEDEYYLTVKELERITGSITHTLRLSMFHGNIEAVTRLNNLGVNCLLTADDDRVSYYLDEEVNDYITNHDSYTAGPMKFVSTDFRLDKLSIFEVILKLQKILFDMDQNRILVVFTHESLLNNEMFNKIEVVCKYAHRYNYQFVTEL